MFRRRQGSGIVDPEGVESEEETGTQLSQKMGQRAMGIGILGWIHLTPRWENNSVWRHDGVNGRVARGG